MSSRITFILRVGSAAGRVYLKSDWVRTILPPAGTEIHLRDPKSYGKGELVFVPCSYMHYAYDIVNDVYYVDCDVIKFVDKEGQHQSIENAQLMQSTFFLTLMSTEEYDSL